jgi:hypothetical protein
MWTFQFNKIAFLLLGDYCWPLISLAVTLLFEIFFVTLKENKADTSNTNDGTFSSTPTQHSLLFCRMQ